MWRMMNVRPHRSTRLMLSALLAAGQTSGRCYKKGNRPPLKRQAEMRERRAPVHFTGPKNFSPSITKSETT